MENQPNNNDQSKQPQDPLLEKDPDILSTIQKEKERKSERIDFTAHQPNGMEQVLEYIKTHRANLIIYFFLLIGLFGLFFGDFFIGSVILGLIIGYQFSPEIVFYLRNLSHLFDGHEHVRFLIMTVGVIALILAIPGMFIGSIIAAVFKHVIYDHT